MGVTQKYTYAADPAVEERIAQVIREITDETVLEEESHAYVATESEAMVGADGKEVWTFKALKEGESTIIMEYRRPWEQEVEPDKVFILTVVVK